MKLCITGGGTGGHLMVAESLANAAVKDGHEVIFIGSTSGQDRNYFEGKSSFSHVYFLHTSGVVNKKGFAKIMALYMIIVAFFQARTLLKKHKIVATYSVGGFSAAPASFATLSRFLPLYIHEQNAVTGKLNALLKKYAKRFVSAYDANSPIKGYPVKDIFYKSARVRNRIGTIIFLGGSQGAKAINDLALEVALELQKKGIYIIHQAGERDYERVKEMYKRLHVDVQLYSFTKDLASLIQKADVAVSRAGASTLWELTTNGLPAFYVPYPYAAGDHQYFNAKFIVDNEMGWCERESDELSQKLLAILDTDVSKKSEKLLAYRSKDVARQMIEDVALNN